MYFKRIEMHGFKSFAEPVVIDFHEGVTCIVGPNGSGKSNISDAIRWVLGEQSPKMLRDLRLAVPAKMTSSILPPRSILGLCSPSTQRKEQYQ